MQSWPIKAKPLGSWFPKRAVISLQALRDWFLFFFLKTNQDFLENTTFSCFAVSSRHDICPEKT
jgi:hypothetical protein